MKIKNLLTVITLMLYKSVMAMWIDNLVPLNALSYSDGAFAYNGTYYNFKNENAAPEVVQYNLDVNILNKATPESWRCTGTIMDHDNSTLLLTAAHCLKPVGNKNKNGISITFKSTSEGSYITNLTIKNPSVSVHVLYGDYGDYTYTDVGKIELTGALGTPNNLEPTFPAPIIKVNRLPSNIQQNSPLIIFGGSPYSESSPTYSDPAFPLQLVIYNYSWIITGNVASGYHYKEDSILPKYIYTCSGDSGGPMMLKENGQLYLFGIHTGSTHTIPNKCGYTDKVFAPVTNDTFGLINKPV